MSDTTDPIVHILYGGKTLCQMPGPPNTWPKNHAWVSLANSTRAARDAHTMCVECVKARQERSTMPLPNHIKELVRRVPASVLSNGRLWLRPQDAEPQELRDGDLWFREDLKEYRLRRDGKTVTIDEDEAKRLHENAPKD